MLRSPCDPGLMPGTWNLWKTGKDLLLFACPKCGDVFVVLRKVSDEGKVWIKCPQGNCPFRDNVLLVGWSPGRGSADPCQGT